MARFVIPDIHGCSSTLKALVEQLQLSINDKLYFLGDYIDRGTDSSGVLDFILNLEQKGYQIFSLLGNHEKDMLDAEQEYDTYTFFKYAARLAKSSDLVGFDGKIKSKYKTFFHTLEYYFELDDFLLVHAGFNFDIDKPFTDKIAMLESRNFRYDLQKAKEKTIIHGHSLAYLSEIQEAIHKRRMIIPLDNGCVYNKKHRVWDYKQLGQLCAFNLDTYQLYLQKNID